MSHAARPLLAACLAVCAAFYLPQAGLADPPQPSPAASPAAPDLPAPLKAKLDEMMKTLAKTARAQLAENMQEHLESVVRVTGLDEAGRKKLQEAAAGAVDAALQKALDTERKNLAEQWRPLGSVGYDAVMSQLLDALDEVAQYMLDIAAAWPADQAPWQDALRRTLSPAQAGAWAAEEQKRRQALSQTIGDLPQRFSDFSKTQLLPGMNQMVAKLAAGAQLSNERQEALKAEGTAIVKNFTDQAKAQMEISLFNMNDARLKEALAECRQSLFVWIPERPGDEWENRLEKSLTPEELNRLHSAKAEGKNRTAEAYAKVMVSLIDERIALTAAQRPQLETLCAALVLSARSTYLGASLGNHSDYMTTRSISSFYGASTEIPADKVKAILDPVQWRRWQELPSLRDVQETNFVQPTIHLPPATDEEAPPPAQPGDVERIVSEYLAQRSAFHERSILSAAHVKAEDVSRVAHLPPDLARRLQTAACGDAENALGQWEENVEQMVRSTVGEGSPDIVKQRLQNIAEYRFQDRFMPQFGSSNIDKSRSYWDRTLTTALTGSQRAAWQQEVDARKLYRQKAIAAFCLTTFENEFSLIGDQITKLQPKVEKLLIENGDELSNFSGGYWYLQSYDCCLPLAGIPAPEMRAILTQDQWREWTSSNEYSNAVQFWANINPAVQQAALIKGKRPSRLVSTTAKIVQKLPAKTTSK